MKRIYYLEEPNRVEKENGIVEMIGDVDCLHDVDAIYTENSGVKHLMDIRDELRERDVDIPIYVITNQYRKSFLHSLIPSVEVISDEKSSAEIAMSMNRDVEREQERDAARFTFRERQVLEEIGYGLCTKEICVTLGMSERSVRRYKTKLLEKTGLMSSGQLGLYALTNSLVD